MLLANRVDRTLLRNDVAFEIARKCPALPWTPRGLFVELYLNGKHRGNYYLCEHIKIDKNRVNIDETKSLWYGYLFEHDSFKSLVKERWLALKPEFEKVFVYIDEKAEYI